MLVGMHVCIWWEHIGVGGWGCSQEHSRKMLECQVMVMVEMMWMVNCNLRSWQANAKCKFYECADSVR